MTSAAPYKHLYLVDGSGYIFRAYFAIPPRNTSDGTPTNAAFGFTNMLIKLLRESDADGIAVIFDKGARSFPQRDLSGLQGPPARPAGRSDPAVRDDPRGDPRL